MLTQPPLYTSTDSPAMQSWFQMVWQRLVNESHLRMETEQTASGTSVDFTDIPSWVRRISITFRGISTNGTSIPIVQLGDSGGIETTGYLGSAGDFNAGGQVGALFTTGFGTNNSWAGSAVLHGCMILTLTNKSTNSWVASYNGGRSDVADILAGAGSKSLSATLDRLRFTTVGGVNTFDAGSINILME